MKIAIWLIYGCWQVQIFEKMFHCSSWVYIVADKHPDTWLKKRGIIFSSIRFSQTYMSSLQAPAWRGKYQGVTGKNASQSVWCLLVMRTSDLE